MKICRFFVIILTSVVFTISSKSLYAQIDQLHGDQNYSTYGVHSGNQIRTSFWNDGQLGYRNPSTQEQVRGEWPINSGHYYVAKISSFWGAEVLCEDGIKRPIVSEANGTRAGQNTEHSSGDASDEGDYWSMIPLPGFYEDDLEKIYQECDNTGQSKPDQAWVAMSDKEWSWPETWPDRMDDALDPGWSGKWNGLFGKDVFVADQESYYVMDDYNNKEFPFYPDSADLERRGLGLRVSVRGLQWAHPALEDILFWLFDAQNVGTYSYNKMALGVNAGLAIGSFDSGDDNGSYDLENDLAYQFDEDNIGGSDFASDENVGLLGLAFLETPGNPNDGIDNDGDGIDGSGPVITEDMFKAKTINMGDSIVIINYNTYDRSLATIPAEGVTITSQDQDTTIMPGLVEEIPNNLIDDNLNGLIDENNGRTVGTGAMVYLNTGLKYIDYFTGGGSDNLLIDESRQDGIDNDGDWDPLTDDVGLDGVEGTLDYGEGDGLPTSGVGTDMPGEPNIDYTDNHETDQLGLTSYILFDVHEPYRLFDDDRLWSAVQPGYLDITFGPGNTDMIFGSGFFPFKASEIKQYCIGYIMGYPFDDLISNKKNAQLVYDSDFRLEALTSLNSPTGQAAPVKFKLNPNYPNPFNPITTIQYQLAEDSDVLIQVYDIQGRLVKTLIDRHQQAGYYDHRFNATGLASGLYFYRIQAGKFNKTRKMMVLK